MFDQEPQVNLSMSFQCHSETLGTCILMDNHSGPLVHVWVERKFYKQLLAQRVHIESIEAFLPEIPIVLICLEINGFRFNLC